MMRILRTSVDPVNEGSLTDITLVIDIDHTMAHTREEIESLKASGILDDPANMDLLKHIYVFDLTIPGSPPQKKPMYTVFRPNWDRFARFSSGYFRVIIVYTAGIATYALVMSDRAFRDTRKPDLICSSENCEEDAETGARVVKRLDELCKIPSLKGIVKPNRMLILDDNKKSFQFDEDKAVHIKGYVVEPTAASIAADEDSLVKFEQWLLTDEVRNAPDLRLLDKSKIFN